MINKKSIWFLTLFSLIIVLSIYYVTMPSELLLNTNGNYFKDEKNVDNVNKDWTMLLDFTSNIIENGHVILHCMTEGYPYPGLCLDINNNSLRLENA